jgi:heme oxygenase
VTSTDTPAERLRASTRAWHAALEATGFASAMLAGTLPLDRYVGQLAAYRMVLGALEDELSRATCAAVTQVWSADLVKLPLIERDLRYFAQFGTAPGTRATAQARSFVQAVRHTAASDPDALLGFLYVLEGSTLGALMLRRQVSAAYGLRETDGVAYYSSGDRDRWAHFTARLNQAVRDPAVQARVITAALDAYRHTAAVAEALSADLSPAPGSAR